MIQRVPPRLRRTWVQRGILLMNLSLIAVSLGLAVILNYGYGRAASINRVALGRSLTPVPEDVEPGERVLNILLVGSDSSAGLDDDDPIQIGRQGERFGDVIIIAHIDERSGEIALLSLPRDLWVDIAGTGRSSRINRAFVTGGPATLIETIEAEFDIPIHHYVNVDFAGFQGLVAAVGSVDVYFETPARDWNANAVPEPRSQTGFLMSEPGCQSLDPETALAYVRSRYYQTQDATGRWVTDPTSDLGRIRRQQDFLRRTVQRAISVGARNPFVLRDLVETGLENVAIDQRLTPQLLVDLGMAYRSFDPNGLQTYSFPAVDGRVGRNQVLLPLQDEAEPVLELFRGAPFDDPSTVGVTVITDDGTGSTGPVDGAADRARLRMLRQAGFRVTTETGSDLPAGLVIRHGPDGRHAAELLAAGFDEAARLEQVGGLTGRSLRVLFGSSQAADVELAAPPATDDAAPAPAGDAAAGGEAEEAAGLHTTETDAGQPEGDSTAVDEAEVAGPIVEEQQNSQKMELESGSAQCG